MLQPQDRIVPELHGLFHVYRLRNNDQYRFDTASALLSLQKKGCGLWTLSYDFVPHNYETLEWLSWLPTLTQKSFWWWQCSDRYIIYLFFQLHIPSLLLSLVVSVDVKHHVSLPVEVGLLVFHFQAGTGALERLISWAGIVQVCMPG